MPPTFAASLHRDLERLRRPREEPPEHRSPALEVGTAVAIALGILVVALTVVYLVGLFTVPRPTLGG